MPVWVLQTPSASPNAARVSERRPRFRTRRI